jgi:putative zinc finger protein
MPSEPRTEPTLEELSAYVDNELDAGSQVRIAEHVAGCHECQERLAGLRQTAYAIRSLPMETPPRAITVPESRRQAWHWAPAGWIGSAAVAVLVIGFGLAQLHPFGASPTAGVATLSRNSGSSFGAQPGAAPPAVSGGSGAVTRADKSVAGENSVTVVDPRNSSRQLGVATDRAAYSPSGTLVVNGLTIGGNSGEITIMLRRGSYGVRLAPPSTTRSSSGLAFSGSYVLSGLPLVDPRAGSYVLTVTWTDSSGVSLIAELPVSITG